MSLTNNSEEQVQVLVSSEWKSDNLRTSCVGCRKLFNDVFNRRHHCRLCGDVFCGECTQQRALIPPSSIVLQPLGGKKVKAEERTNIHPLTSLQPGQGQDPDRRLTFKKIPAQPSNDVSGAPSFNLTAMQEHEEKEQSNRSGDLSILEDDLISLSFNTEAALSYGSDVPEPYHNQKGSAPGMYIQEPLLYGKGLEERMKLAREPLRVCRSCYDQLQHLQEELRNCNSNAMRYNSIDPAHVRRLLNSPVAFTLGHEVRKAAYTLNNLLPLPKRMGAFTPSSDFGIAGDAPENCSDVCQTIAGNFANLDGVRIPARLLEMAKGVAVMTVVKGGIGFAGLEFGTGLVVSRLEGDSWSPPCAIGSVSASVGALVGAQISDHVFLLMTDDAVDIMSSNSGSVQLGVDVGVAVGPLGRSAEADMGLATQRLRTGDDAVAMAPIYTYSQSKGFYAGFSFDGKVVVTRHEVNERFYGRPVDPRELLSGDVVTPPAAQPLYDALRRCHVYASAKA